MATTWQVCAVCGYVLARVGTSAELTDKDEYVHLRLDQQDHIAVPVDADQIQLRRRCDFCDAEEVADVVCCTRFRMPIPGVPQYSVGGWAACSGCAPLVRRRRWSELITRVRALPGNGGLVPRAPRRMYEALYRAVEANITEQISFEEWQRRGQEPTP